LREWPLRHAPRHVISPRCIRETKMAMEEKDWEGAAMHVKRHLEFKQMQQDGLMTEAEVAVMDQEQVLAMSEVMKDLEIKLVQSLIVDFAAVSASASSSSSSILWERLGLPTWALCGAGWG
jgi:hypothetical protein